MRTLLIPKQSDHRLREDEKKEREREVTPFGSVPAHHPAPLPSAIHPGHEKVV